MDGTDLELPAHLESHGLPAGVPPGLPAEARWLAERTSHSLDERLREVLRLGGEVRRAFARRLALSENEVSAMEHLAAGPIGPVELSRRLGISSAAGTQLLHRLVGAGHVTRHPHPGDRRRQVLVPTGSGMAGVFRELRPMVEALDTVALELNATERDVVARYLDRVAEVLRRTVEEGPPTPS